MAGALIRDTWRHAASPVRGTIALALVSFPFVSQMAEHGNGLPEPVTLAVATAVLGAGLLGRDRTSGMLPLILARPMTRHRYVMSRWLGACLLGWSLAAVNVIASLAFAAVACAEGLPVPGTIARTCGAIALSIGTVTAVLALFSALAPGDTDIAAACGSLLLLLALRQGASLLSMADLGDVLVREGGRALFPWVRPDDGIGAVLASTSYAAIALCVAVLIVNRRDIAASGGA